MYVPLESTTILQLNLSQLASYFRILLKKHSAKAVSISLLVAIEREAVPPTVYDTFLSTVDDPPPLIHALRQKCSKHVRYVTIAKCGKALRGKAWNATWDELGGTQGLLALFAEFSVHEVAHLARAIGRCSGRIAHNEMRRVNVTELLQGLLPSSFPDCSHQSTDQRALQQYYAQLVPACTSEFVMGQITRERHPFGDAIPTKYIAKYHFQPLRRLILDLLCHEFSLSNAMADNILQTYLPLLLGRVPPTVGAEPGFSASMSFAATVLEVITTHGNAILPNSKFRSTTIFTTYLVKPLMHKLKAHKIKSSRVQEIISLVIRYLQKDQRAREELSFARGGLLSATAKYWCNDAPTFESQLISLISLRHDSSPPDLNGYCEILRVVRRSRRYALLRLICYHSPNAVTNIELDQDIKETSIKSWPVKLFLLLEQDHGLSLLERLLRTDQKDALLKLKHINSIFFHSPFFLNDIGDHDILLAHLRQGQDRAEIQTRETIAILKAKSSKCKEQTERAYFAKSAVFVSIASGSLELYGEVVMWQKRFQADYHTMKTINETRTCNTEEGITLLSGIPDNLYESDAIIIKDRVAKANDILSSFLESAMSCMREPSFNRPDWFGVLSLFRLVAMSRTERAGKLKSQLQFSEDQIYHTLWSDTLDLFLRVETLGLDEENITLGLNSPHGILSFSIPSTYRTGQSEILLPSSYRFLDNLARARDELWQRKRPKIVPAVVGLDPPWPRGLPFQCLIGSFNIAKESAGSHMPYVASRAARVVMLEPVLALASPIDDEELAHAIGPFVDNFESALAMYIMQMSPGQERETLLKEAYVYATTNLSSGRLTKAEAESFWKPIFRRALPSENLQLLDDRSSRIDVTIPTILDPFGITEWNPNDSSSPRVKPRKLEPKIIDCLLTARKFVSSIDETFNIPILQTEGIDAISVWSPQLLMNVRGLAPSIQEALIFAALLLEASKITGSSRALKLPFPSAGNVRCPNLFLDQEFLDGSEKLQPQPIQVLTRCIRMVPPSLLYNLTESAMNLLSQTPSGSKNFASTMRTAYELLDLLVISDRPQSALDFVNELIVNRPDASSWHRQYLTASFVRNLEPDMAQKLISSCTASICDLLESQRKAATPPNASEDPIDMSKPRIKVTTVKMLAKFLEDADFVSPEFAVEILSQLFQSGHHIDIRTAVINGILTMLKNASRTPNESSNVLINQLVSVLEAAVPIMGSLNGRTEILELEWAEAEKTGKLPEIGIVGGPWSMLGLVLSAITSDQIKSQSVRRIVIERVILPTIEMSTAENHRWMRMFVSKHSSPGQTIDLPRLPANPKLFNQLLQSKYHELPISILCLYHEYILINIQPPAVITTFNTKIQNNRTLRDSNEGLHWLSLFGRGPELLTPILPEMLTKPWQPTTLLANNGIQITNVQGFVFEQAMLLSRLNDVSFADWHAYISAFAPPTHQSPRDHIDAWLSNAKPVLERIVEGIEGLRTPQWQRSPNRSPEILPPTYALSLWRLQYPHFCISSDPWERIAEFLRQLSRVLDGVLELGLAHHSKLTEIETAVLRCSPEDRIYVAFGLGDFEPADEGERAKNVLRAGLVEALMAGVEFKNIKDQDIKDKFTIMLDKWRRCEDEDIRLSGMKLIKNLDLEE